MERPPPQLTSCLSSLAFKHIDCLGHEGFVPHLLPQSNCLREGPHADIRLPTLRVASALETQKPGFARGEWGGAEPKALTKSILGLHVGFLTSLHSLTSRPSLSSHLLSFLTSRPANSSPNIRCDGRQLPLP